MESKGKTIEKLEAELEELRHQLFEATETIEAIRTGQVDALVVESSTGHQLYSLKTADQSYRVFIEKMTEGAVTLSKEGIILYSNSQFASMIHVPLSAVMGAPFRTFISEDFADFFQDIFHKCWKEDCKEEVLLAAGQHTIPVQLSITALELEEGVSLSVIITDLTAQKKTQLQLEQKNEELAQMNHALELSNHDLQQFASVASHDLQEPLRKIQIFSNLLQEHSTQDQTPEGRKYLDKIVFSASRMKSLIIDVLNYSKLSANHQAFDYLSLNDIVNEVIDDFELLIRDKNATVEVQDMPSIEINRGQVRQMFQNIISNALKFSRTDTPPLIIIGAKRVGQKSFDSPEKTDGPFCLISIKDNGIGFNQKYVSNIFDLFQRLHSKDAYEGTGIGLAITKKIVEKHNGIVSARSANNNGAEFLILLPVSQNGAFQ